MQNTLNIRSIVEQELQQKGYNLSRFSQVSGMNRGTLSLILNGNPSKLPSIPQMDKIAEALGYEQGWLYELYLEECFDREVPHWRRLKNFLYRCIQLDKEELIDKALHRLMEDCSQTAAVFDAAEEWYDEGYRQVLLPFYRYVTVNEKYRHAERLAISHYRIFRLSQSENFENNLRAAITFEPYRHELPVGFRLDGLLKLANIYFNQHMWKKVEFFADELRELAMEAYKNKLHLENNINNEYGLKTERHLVVYYAHSYLMKGNALEKQGAYEDALQYIDGYSDLSWFVGLDHFGKQDVEKFKFFAKANYLTLKLLMGNIKVLDNYVNLLRNNSVEILPGLITILEAANKHNFSIDVIIEEFNDELSKYEIAFPKELYYSETSTLERYTNLCKKLAVYYCNKSEYNKSAKYIFLGFKHCLRMNQKNNFIAFIVLFESIREYLTKEQLDKYEFLMRGVIKSEEGQKFINHDIDM